MIQNSLPPSNSSLVVVVHVHHRLQTLLLELGRFLLRRNILASEKKVEKSVDVRRDDEPSSSLRDGSRPLGSRVVDVNEVLEEVELGSSRDLRKRE